MELPPQQLGRIPDSKRVTFVRPSENVDLAPSEPQKLDGTLSGPEARSFYQELVSEPSTSGVKLECVEEPFSNTNFTRRIKKMKEDYVREFDVRSINRFLKAATEGDTKTIKEMLAEGICVDSRDDFGWTALMCATVAGHLSTARMLLLFGADWYALDYTDKNVFDILHQKKMFHLSQALQIVVEEILNPEVVTIEDDAANYCESCRKRYSTSEAEHLSSTAHILLSSKEGTKYPGYMIPSANIGYRLLKENGWDENQGLGKEGAGKKFPIRTVLKGDRGGLGLQKTTPRVTHFEPRDPRAVESIKAINAREKKERLKRSQQRSENLAKEFQQTWSDRGQY